MSNSTTAEAGQQFRPWPPWRMGQLTPQETLPEEGGKQARGQPLPGLPVHGTRLEVHSAPLSPQSLPRPLLGSDPPAGEALWGGRGKPLLGRGAHRSRLQGHSAPLSSQSLPPSLPLAGQRSPQGRPLGEAGLWLKEEGRRGGQSQAVRGQKARPSKPPKG